MAEPVALVEERPTATCTPVRRPFAIVSFVSLSSAAILAAVVATLHSLAIVPLAFEQLPITGVRHLEGFAYYAALPPDPYLVPLARAELLYENGRPAPFPMVSGYGVITKSGNGRFHVSAGTLFFSAFDNSDPTSNGRRYSVTRPLSLPQPVLPLLWLAALGSTVVLAMRFRLWLLGLLARPPLWTVAGLLVTMVIANRLWIFVAYPIPAIHPDSGSYYALTDQLDHGQWPEFGIRPPGYPLLMKAVFSVTDRVLALVMVQCALSTMAALMLVYAFCRWHNALGIPAAVLMAAYLMSTAAMEHDTAMLSESLYTTLQMFSFACLLLALRRVRPVLWMAASSIGMALAILTRPGGMFLTVIYAMVLAFMLWNRFGRRTVIAFALPLPLLLLMMCVYNWRTIHVFGVSAWGEANLAVGTFTFWQTDPAYPPEINQGIRDIQSFVRRRMKETGVDTLLDSTWNPAELSRVFILGFHADPLDIATKMGGGGYNPTGRAWIRRIAIDSIRKRPLTYTKFVYSMLYNYYRPWPEDDFRGYLMNRTLAIFVERRFSAANHNLLLTRMAKEFADASPPPTVVIANADPSASVDLTERVLLASTAGLRVYQLTWMWHQRVFSRWLWPIVAFVTFLISVIMLVASRARNTTAFAAFIVLSAMVGASLVVALVEYSQPRYSYPMEWTYMIAPLFLPMLFRRQLAAPAAADSPA